MTGLAQLGQALLRWAHGRQSIDKWLFYVLAISIVAFLCYLAFSRGISVADLNQIASAAKGNWCALALIVPALISLATLLFRAIFYPEHPANGVETAPAQTESPDGKNLSIRLDATGNFSGGFDAARPVLSSLYDGERGLIAIVDDTRGALSAELEILASGKTRTADQDRRLEQVRDGIANRDRSAAIFAAALGLYRGAEKPVLTRNDYAAFAAEMLYASGIAPQPPERTVRAALAARDWPHDGPASRFSNNVPFFLTPEEHAGLQKAWDSGLDHAGVTTFDNDRRRFAIPIAMTPLPAPRVLAPIVAHLIEVLADARAIPDPDWGTFRRNLDRIRGAGHGHDTLYNHCDWVLLMPELLMRARTDPKSLRFISFPPTGPEFEEWLRSQGRRSIAS